MFILAGKIFFPNHSKPAAGVTVNIGAELLSFQTSSNGWLTSSQILLLKC